MLNPKHDWSAFQMLHLSVLDCRPKLFFSEDSSVSPVSPFHSILCWKQVGWKKNCYAKLFHFPRDKHFFFKCPTLHISKISSFFDLKRSKNLVHNKSWESLDTRGKLHGSLTLGIHTFVQLRNSVPELKLIKQDYLQRCNGRLFQESIW